MVIRIFKRASWIDMIISIIFVIFGAFLIKKPQEVLMAISTILGIVFIAMGVLKLIEYYIENKKEDYLLMMALISVIFGTIIMFESNSILAFFRVILGLWIVATGVLDFQINLKWKEFKSPYCLISILFSILIMFIGIIILVNKNILITTMGSIIIIYGVLDIIDRIIFMNKIEDYIKKN